MFEASKQTLKRLALLVWSSGVIVLYAKSVGLLITAQAMDSGQVWVWLAVVGGIVLGVFKSRFLFRKLCIKNLNRIDALSRPMIWEFFRVRFFIFLFAMILVGKYLSLHVHDNYTVLVAMIIIEISIATALLGSCHCFWRKCV